MCGIIAALKAENDIDLVEKVKNQLQDQISRGKEGFGIVVIDKNRKVKVLRATQLMECLLQLRFDCGENPLGVILHHRQPTSTANLIGQTHPIMVSNPKLKHDYLVVHNGTVSEDDERFKKHIELGYKYTTYMEESRTKTEITYRFNDSECFAVDLARFIEGKAKGIETKGSAALVALQIDKATGKALKIFWTRNTNPLNVFRKKKQKFLMLSSEGKGKPAESGKLFAMDIATWKKDAPKALTIPGYSYSTAGYNYYNDDRTMCKTPSCSVYTYNADGFCNAHRVEAAKAKATTPTSSEWKASSEQCSAANCSAQTSHITGLCYDHRDKRPAENVLEQEAQTSEETQEYIKRRREEDEDFHTNIEYAVELFLDQCDDPETASETDIDYLMSAIREEAQEFLEKRRRELLDEEWERANAAEEEESRAVVRVDKSANG